MAWEQKMYHLQGRSIMPPSGGICGRLWQISAIAVDVNHVRSKKLLGMKNGWCAQLCSAVLTFFLKAKKTQNDYLGFFRFLLHSQESAEQLCLNS